MFSAFSIKGASAQEAFAAPQGASKSQRGSSSQTAGSGPGAPGREKRALDEAEMEPLPDKQAAWVHRGITNMLQNNFVSFGQAVEAQFNELEKKIDTKLDKVDKKVDGLQSECQLIRTNVANDMNVLDQRAAAAVADAKTEFDSKYDGLKKELDDFKEEQRKSIGDLRVLATAPRATAAGLRPSHPASSNFGNVPPGLEVPVNQRKIACLGNLSWDEAPANLIEKANAILQEVGFSKPADFTDVQCPSRRPTSFVHITCTAHAKIAELSKKVDELRRSSIPSQPTKYVFANVAKTGAERAPTRMLRKAEAMLNQAEARFEQAGQIKHEAIPFERCVKSDNKVFAYIDFDNMLRFTDAARSRYQAEELTIIQVAAR